jgi:hypothetical protein
MSLSKHDHYINVTRPELHGAFNALFPKTTPACSVLAQPSVMLMR